MWKSKGEGGMERKYLINGDTGAQLFFYIYYEGICALNLREGHSLLGYYCSGHPYQILE